MVQNLSESTGYKGLGGEAKASPSKPVQQPDRPIRKTPEQTQSFDQATQETQIQAQEPLKVDSDASRLNRDTPQQNKSVTEGFGKALDNVLGSLEEKEEAPAKPDFSRPPSREPYKPDFLSSTMHKVATGEIEAGTGNRADTANISLKNEGGFFGLLGRSEATDKGRGYNETLGYGAYTGGDVNLVNMTLGEVRTLQDRMLADPNNNLNSSAVGRYQIVGKTLDRLKTKLKISDDQKFTPELQDRLAKELLVERGLKDWQKGNISDSEFLDNLSQEWASLPGANGKGAYAGQKASVTIDEVLSSFGGRKEKPDVYANIPDIDGAGESGQKEKFRFWNPDPIGNEEKNLREIDPRLSSVIKKAKELSPVSFVLGSGKRTKEQQEKAVEFGWSQTKESDHLGGEAVDLWPVVDGKVKFDPDLQKKVVKYMKLAALQQGIDLDVGAEWTGFKDLPHFAIKSSEPLVLSSLGD